MYKFIEDPGHGWLEVTMKELIDLGIADKISSCSYRKNGTAYLEEDCDMGVFLEAKYGVGRREAFVDFFKNEVESEYAENVFVRNLDNYWFNA